MRAIAELGAWECLRSGVTTIGDCSFVGAAAEAAAATGLRATVFLEVFGEDASALDRFHEHAARDRARALRARAPGDLAPRAVHLHRRRLRGGRSPRAADADPPRGKPRRAPWLVEGAGDWTPLAEFLVPPPGETGVRLLAQAGLLGPTLSAAHGVHLDAEEIELLAAHGVGVAHCPRSNGFLGCGVAPLAEFLEAGLPVGIATDSPASTPSFDLFEELRAAIVGARAREQRPDALTAAKALELATLGGARVLGLDAEIGSLAPGKWADLAVISLEGSPLEPVEDPVAAVVLGGSPERVVATLVAGETCYRRGTTAWPDTTRAARSARSRMLL